MDFGALARKSKFSSTAILMNAPNWAWAYLPNPKDQRSTYRFRCLNLYRIWSSFLKFCLYNPQVNFNFQSEYFGAPVGGVSCRIPLWYQICALCSTRLN